MIRMHLPKSFKMLVDNASPHFLLAFAGGGFLQGLRGLLDVVGGTISMAVVHVHFDASPKFGMLEELQ